MCIKKRKNKKNKKIKRKIKKYIHMCVSTGPGGEALRPESVALLRIGYVCVCVWIYVIIYIYREREKHVTIYIYIERASRCCESGGHLAATEGDDDK